MEGFVTKKGTKLPLLNLKGKPYLQVPQRVQWFREDHPLGRIDTECITINDKLVIFKAIISIPNEKGEYVKLADADKQENFSHFADAMEKAQTGAVGRALALCGYGTQFAIEMDEGERIVDAPTNHRIPKPQNNTSNDPGDWVVNSGKEHYGKKLKDIPDFELMRCLQLIKDHAHTTKQEINAPSQQFIQKAEAYLSKKFDDEHKFQ